MRRSARLVLVAGAVLLTHAPASGQDGWEPPAGRKCDKAFAQFRVPTVGEATDSAALFRDLASYLSAPGRRLERIDLAVEYEKSGAVKRVEFDEDLPKEDKRALGRILRTHLKPQPTQKKGYSIVASSSPAGGVPACRCSR